MEKEKQVISLPEAELKATGTFSIKNYDVIKEQVTSICTKYKSWVIEEKDIEEAKEIKANLNKVKDAYDDTRKAFEKEYMEPFNVGKKQIKELCTMLNGAYTNINNQLKEMEEKNRKERLESLSKELEDTIYSESMIKLPIEKLIKEEWLNKSTKKKEIIEEAVKIKDELNSAYDLLKYVKPSIYKYEILHQFTKEFDIESIVPTMTRIMNENATLHLNTAKQLKLEREKEVDKKQYEIRYIVNGSRDDLKRLSEILKEYGFKYSVEKGEE